jgi:hypothetical protein
MPGLNLSLEAYQAKEIGQHNEKQGQRCDTDEIPRYASDESYHSGAHLNASKRGVAGRIPSLLIVFRLGIH